jgi:hypothetical protein
VRGRRRTAGEFIWREQGSRHAAWSPQGVLMLATLRGPNKFFMADGRVIDGSGKDWDEMWGQAARGLRSPGATKGGHRSNPHE